VGVGGDAIGEAEAALTQGGDEVAPVRFGFGQGGGDAQGDAFAIQWR